MANVRVQVIVPEEIAKALQAESDKLHGTVSWLARNILIEHVYTVHIPALSFTGKGDEIGNYFKTKEG
jgi:hypothetical protein